MDNHKALKYSKIILELHSELDELIRNKLDNFLDENNFEILSDCRSLLSKAQSKLIKRNNPDIFEDSIFQERMVYIWEQSQLGSKNRSSSFSDQFAESNKRNPLVLKAFRDAIRLNILSKSKQAIRLGHNNRASLFIKTLPKKDRKAIEEAMTTTSFENAISKLYECITNEQLTLNRPYIHCRLNYSDFAIVEKLMEHAETKFFQALTSNLLQLKHPISVSTSNLPYFVQQNVDHPIVQGAAHEVCASIFEEFIKQIENFDWIAADSEYCKCIQFLTRDTNIRKCLDAKKLDLSVIDGLKYTAKKHREIANNYRSSLTTLPRFVEKKHVCVQSICSDWGKVSKEQEDLFNLAYEALWHSVEQFTISNNFVSREDTHYDTDNYSPEKLKLFIENLCLCRHKFVQKEISFLCKEKYRSENFFTSSFAIEKAAQRYFIGNCGYLSRSVFAELMKRLNPEVNVHVFSIRDGDHSFTIINLDPKADLLNPAEWKNAIVCDPWARRIYSSEYIPEILNDYVRLDKIGKPILRKFNPNDQKLEVDGERICSVVEFQKLISIDYPLIEKKLDQFHSAKNQSEKELLAFDLLKDIAKQSNPLDFNVFKMLEAQLNFFLNKKI